MPVNGASDAFMKVNFMDKTAFLRLLMTMITSLEQDRYHVEISNSLSNGLERLLILLKYDSSRPENMDQRINDHTIIFLYSDMTLQTKDISMLKTIAPITNQKH